MRDVQHLGTVFFLVFFLSFLFFFLTRMYLNWSYEWMENSLSPSQDLQGTIWEKEKGLHHEGLLGEWMLKLGRQVSQLGAMTQIKRIWPTQPFDCQVYQTKDFSLLLPIFLVPLPLTPPNPDGKAGLGLKACFSLFTGPEHPYRLQPPKGKQCK